MGAIDNAGDTMSVQVRGSAHATSPTTLVMIKSDIYCCKGIYIPGSDNEVKDNLGDWFSGQ